MDKAKEKQIMLTAAKARMLCVEAVYTAASGHPGGSLSCIDALTELSKPIDAFFDGVLVMDKDEAVKNNRLGLLKSIDETVNCVADFTKIVF